MKNHNSAAYYALSIDHFTSELGYALLGYPPLLQLMTFASILLEWTGPLLLLLPVALMTRFLFRGLELEVPPGLIVLVSRNLLLLFVGVELFIALRFTSEEANTG